MSANRALGEDRVDGRDAAHEADAVALDQLPEVREQRRVAVSQGSRPHHALALEHRREQGDDQGVDVEERQRGEGH